MRKRILALLLVSTIMITSLPTNVFAQETRRMPTEEETEIVSGNGAVDENEKTEEILEDDAETKTEEDTVTGEGDEAEESDAAEVPDASEEIEPKEASNEARSAGGGYDYSRWSHLRDQQ